MQNIFPFPSYSVRNKKHTKKRKLEIVYCLDFSSRKGQYSSGDTFLEGTLFSAGGYYILNTGECF